VDDVDDDDDNARGGGRSRGGHRRGTTMEPNVRSYNTFLLALARAGLYEQSEQLLEQMKDRRSLVVPDRITYNTVLLAYAFSREPSAPARATALLREMIQANYNSDNANDGGGGGDGDDAIIASSSRRQQQDRLRLHDESYYVPRPDVVSFNTVLAAWSNLGTKAAARNAQDLLEEMTTQIDGTVRPDVYSYTTVVQAWARCGGESHLALRLLRDMTTTAPNSASAEAPGTATTTATGALQPNKVTYTIVMQALCRDKKPKQAVELLEEMIRRSYACPELRPDVVTFSALIDGWANAADRLPREAVDAVFGLLDRMKEMAEEYPDCAPNERTYTSVLSALARSRQWEAGPRAEQVLREMRDRGCPPSVIHWNAVLNAYAKSPRSDKVTLARRIWATMMANNNSYDNGDAAPDGITYNTLLNVAAQSWGGDVEIQKSSLQMGFDVFRALQRDHNCRANSLTFLYLFKVIRKFMPVAEETAKERRWEIIQRIFELCCQQGCLNDYIIQALLDSRMGLAVEQKKALLGGENWPVDRADVLSVLPPEWSRHALPSKTIGRDRGQSRRLHRAR